ncbi:hypothetical protein QYF36_014185 [Acer negundo]|nr:hypothetical protein QYF36_014185 [Acer negundo]
MDPATMEPTNVCHVVALPYPGRGHINPMMNLCKLLASRQPEILITFVVTEEWLGFIGSEPKPDNIRFGTIPNVIPSELGRAKDFSGFLEAVSTKTEAPFEKFLDRLEYPVTAIVADTYLVWVPGFGNRKNIPVASLWTMSASVFSIFHHFHLLEKHGHFPVELSERGHEIVEYIPGLPPTRLANLPTIFYQTSKQNLHRALECVGEVSKAHYLFFTSVYELEAQVIDSLLAEFPFPVFPIGPAIPYFQVLNKSASAASPATSLINTPNYYLQWLDSQPAGSVLLLRRRCAKDCIFAPYFPSDDPHKFAMVHKVFGASNVSKMLQELPVHQRADAVSSLVYEANARVRDPVYGCVGAISYLQNQVSQLQMQLAVAQAEILCTQMQQEPASLATDGDWAGLRWD